MPTTTDPVIAAQKHKNGRSEVKFRLHSNGPAGCPTGPPGSRERSGDLAVHPDREHLACPEVPPRPPHGRVAVEQQDVDHEDGPSATHEKHRPDLVVPSAISTT